MLFYPDESLAIPSDALGDNEDPTMNEPLWDGISQGLVERLAAWMLLGMPPPDGGSGVHFWVSFCTQGSAPLHPGLHIYRPAGAGLPGRPLVPT